MENKYYENKVHKLKKKKDKIYIFKIIIAINNNSTIIKYYFDT